MKLDLSKKYKSYYSTTVKPRIISFDSVRYISLTGKGDPSGSNFADNIGALYATAYTIKFAAKALNADFVVPKLECQWWYDLDKYPGNTIETAPTNVPRSEWEYRLLLRLPDVVSNDMIYEARKSVREKKGIETALRVEPYTMPAMTFVDMLHIGPFDREPESLLVLSKFMNENNFGKAGLHQEIYLSDFRRTAPEKLKTILREPVAVNS